MINNSCGWKENFGRTNQSLCGIMGISLNTLLKARNKLQQKSLLTFKKGRKSEVTTYSIKEFNQEYSSKYAPQNEPHNEPYIEPQTEPQTEHILNNKLKQKKDYILFCEWFNQEFGRQYRPETYRDKINTRLKNYGIDKLKAACMGMKKSPHMMGDNDEKRIYATLEYITRSDKNVDKWLKDGQIAVIPIPNQQKDDLRKKLY
jgi:hypothetical protein